MKCYDCTLGVINNGNMVLGQGSTASKIIVIGEAPGYREQRLGVPFCGKSGIYLKELLYSVGFNTESMYFSNVVKCRPPANRTPTQGEIDKCKHYIYEEVINKNFIHIICVGSIACSTFLTTFTGINKIIGKKIVLGNRIVYPTYHPSFILRNKILEDIYVSSLINIKSQIYEKNSNIRG